LKSLSTPSSAANPNGEPSTGATATEWRREHFADHQTGREFLNLVAELLDQPKRGRGAPKKAKDATP
jgi:hypothetical protein